LPGWQVPPKQEVVTADGNFSIDIAAVTAAGVRLAVEADGPHHFVSVEVDGPNHFVSPDNRRPTQYRVEGPTQYRNRALAARGYTVISIPYWEWAKQKGGEARLAYLQRKLQGKTVDDSS
jgi:very-short-patch-repair endonuclease